VPFLACIRAGVAAEAVPSAILIGNELAVGSAGGGTA
jgi:hypothetical protein